jgi:hypothetical protein
MKTILTILILTVSVTTTIARPVNLPIDSRQITLITSERPEFPFPACRADISIDGLSGKITSIKIKIDEREHVIPNDALITLSAPNLITMGIQAEKGRDGKTWISLIFQPSEQTDQMIRYHIAIVEDSYSHVRRIWDELDRESRRHQFETLHKQH